MGLLKEGQVICGTYLVDRYLGEGAFAEVYRVNHRFLGRQAMKVFKMTGITNAEIEQILEEAILLSRLGHPNIIRVFDANTTDTSNGICGFFTMEYVAGGTLYDFWSSHGNKYVPVNTAVDIIMQVTRGLSIAHAENPPIIHRDIKPQNILIGYTNSGLCAKLSDFGLAKRVNPLTLMASTRGTLGFKAPEALANYHSDSCSGDVWALGATLYLLLTDRMPYFNPRNSWDEFDNVNYDSQPLISPSNLNIKVDVLLDKIVRKTLAIDPNDRYKNALELLDELQEWTVSKHIFNESMGLEELSVCNGSDSKGNGNFDEVEAKHMIANAIELAKQYKTINEAADLMEEAFNKWPGLRGEYESQVKLWRCGVLSAFVPKREG